MEADAGRDGSLRLPEIAMSSVSELSVEPEGNRSVVGEGERNVLTTDGVVRSGERSEPSLPNPLRVSEDERDVPAEISLEDLVTELIRDSSTKPIFHLTQRFAISVWQF